MLSKNRVRELQSLRQKKYREESGLFLAEGPTIVADMLRSGFMPEELFALQEWLTDEAALLRENTITISPVTEEELKKISLLDTPRQVVALCKTPPADQTEPANGQLYLFLDAIRDPGNMGTLIRLADWFGINRMYASRDTVEWTNPKVIQATMGSFVRVAVVYVEPVEFMRSVRGKLPVYAADLDGEPVYTGSFRSEGLLVISNEARGLSPELEPFITKKLHIPRFSARPTVAESLNAAIAGAIIVSEFRRRSLASPAHQEQPAFIPDAGS